MKQAIALIAFALLGMFGNSQVSAAIPSAASAVSPQKATSVNTAGGAIDCSAVYGGKAASCVRVACNRKYQSFIGTWQGEFSAYVREKSTPAKTVYRPYHDVITYSKDDCLSNTRAGEVFIIGRRSDSYASFEGLPAKIDKGLLITGRKADGVPFLRTVDREGTYDYTLVYQNTAAILSIWSLHMPAAGSNPEMTFTTIDGKDFTTTATQKRNVTITMKVGPENAPFWEGLVAYGSHSKQ